MRAWTTVLVMLPFWCAADAAAQAMPRIESRAGGFFDAQTSQPFSMRGFNYIQLFDDRAWHATFAPGLYDPQQAEAALEEMGRHGFTVARVFIDHEAPNGVVTSTSATELSPVYMDNFVDFLSRARSHGLRVIPSLVYLAQTNAYAQIIGPYEPGIENINRYTLDDGFIAAKAAYAADFVNAVKARDASLLSTVFAYELENEANMTDQAKPFSQTSGTISNTASGITYDLSSPAQKQQLADDNTVVWADTVAAAIRQADPAAMVSVNVFTYQAVGRTGPGFTSGSAWNDERFPARPLALLDANLDYVDVHFYPFNDNTLTGDLASIEYDALIAKSAQTGIPLVSGEFGAFKSAYPNINLAARKMRQHMESVNANGFVGQMLWTYDTDAQTFLWNARSNRGEIFQAVFATYRKLDRSTAPVVQEAFSSSNPAGTLEGKKSDLGGVLWAGGSALHVADGLLRREGSSGGVAAVVPYNPSAEEIIRLYGRVKSPSGSADWVGLGLTDRVAGDDAFWNDGSLWMLLRGNGNYEAWIDGVNMSLLPNHPDAPRFALGAWNDLELIYDVGRNWVWLLINGQPVLEKHELGSLVIPVLGAGLHLFADGAEVSDFELNLLPCFSTLAGDFNADDLVTLSDVNPFKLALTDESAFAQAYPGLRANLVDPNGDGLVTLSDIAAFKTLLAHGSISVPEPRFVELIAAALIIAALLGKRSHYRKEKGGIRGP
ncbi:MAG: cellulase family glycosylhydrolase [Phycisphaeraceae bacterium]|nr:cellulase family glycosylhydrolase [Phycisphaeraceae bacterium]